MTSIDQKAAIRRRARLASSRRQRRLTRTIVLATVALAAAVYYFSDSGALNWEDLQHYLLLSLIGVGGLMVFALVAAMIIRWVKGRS